MMSQRTAIKQDGKTSTVSERVISAVAEELGAERTAIDPLYSVVDPDALDTLYDPDPIGGAHPPRRVTFVYCGCEVEISGDGEVHVTAPEVT